MGEVTECGICGSPELDLLLDMGLQPLAERESPLYPLVLLKCTNCTLVQLSYIVDQQEVFPPDHPYATGNTRFLREHFARLAAELVAKRLKHGDLAVDIGANDGTLLAEIGLAAPGVRLAAVEPTNQARKCRQRGISTYQKFFTPEVAGEILHAHGWAKVITASNVLAHVPDPHGFVHGVTTLLDPDGGVFVTENHDWSSIINGLQVDTIYHEHLRYYSVAALSHLLAVHGLEVSGVEPVPTHGGSLRVTARKTRGSLRNRSRQAMSSLRTLVARAAAAGPVYGIGAATRATPLIHYAGIADQLACVCEVSTSEKIGTCMPGTAIPVVDEAKLVADQPPHALLFSWHIADSLVPKLREMGYRGRLIVPLPEPRIIDG
jgi:2-polyprenyl-3-methyl-5-hydroxy-6-metoxy-1,4-benzoquinol methylase